MSRTSFVSAMEMSGEWIHALAQSSHRAYNGMPSGPNDRTTPTTTLDDESPEERRAYARQHHACRFFPLYTPCDRVAGAPDPLTDIGTLHLCEAIPPPSSGRRQGNAAIDSRPVAIVTYRGTASSQDLGHSLRSSTAALPTPHGHARHVPTVHVHEGYMDVARQCHGTLLSLLDEHVGDLGATELLFTGHSMGGGIALCHALLMAQTSTQLAPNQIKCVTFGAPPIYAPMTRGATDPRLPVAVANQLRFYQPGDPVIELGRMNGLMHLGVAVRVASPASLDVVAGAALRGLQEGRTGPHGSRTAGHTTTASTPNLATDDGGGGGWGAFLKKAVSMAGNVAYNVGRTLHGRDGYRRFSRQAFEARQWHVEEIDRLFDSRTTASSERPTVNPYQQAFQQFFGNK